MIYCKRKCAGPRRGGLGFAPEGYILQRRVELHRSCASHAEQMHRCAVCNLLSRAKLFRKLPLLSEATTISPTQRDLLPSDMPDKSVF